MCGFLGEFLLHQQDPISKVTFEELLKKSSHRGPDHSFSVSESYYQLGFNRLAILDLSTVGNQPKLSPSKRYHVVFNGEIYNFKSLAKKYLSVTATSDTSVLVQLLDLLGIEETIKVLQGMYALAIIDTAKKTISLVRDFAGIKPLFYGVSEHGIVFASQFNQIFNHPFFMGDLELRPAIMKEYFGLGYMSAPNTIYSKVFQVLPGELITFSISGECNKKKITSFDKTIDAPLPFENTTEYQQLLTSIIKEQLVSDVPIATFLSGGIDSPIVSAIAKEQKKSIQAFTLAVDDPAYDESKKAHLYAKHIGIEQTIETIQKEDLLHVVDTHFNYLTEPLGDYSSIPTYIISNLARKNHTVMLSGDGGDELFFGYPRMQSILKKRTWFRIPFRIRKPLIRLSLKLKLTDSWGPYTYEKLDDWILSKHEQIPNHILQKIMPNSMYSQELKDLYHVPKSLTKNKLLHWMRYNEFYGHLQRVLVKVDRMSMANSLEVRVPFLDKKSIHYAWKRIPKIKNNTYILKGLLKKLMSDYYPADIIEQKKKGFSFPMVDWLHGDLRIDVEKHLFEMPIYGETNINVKELQDYVQQFYDDAHQDAWGVWHLYAWQKWARAEGLL
jgi:asparagine synthase (glutamine-hydrolysing)